MSSRPIPFVRRLRGYAFDPSLSTQLQTALVNEIVFRIPWEESGRRLKEMSTAERFRHTLSDDKVASNDPIGDGLFPGPVGEYLEVVDYDPATGCFYAPVDLDEPLALAQDGLSPSEGNPKFHQQMVYAVAMTTIRNFERALGRFALWAPRKGSDPKHEQEAFVRRLRIYPHALREANAYYSPARKALLFGYFPAAPTNRADGHFPGGMVFTCLSHDIIAHETTHALLDGMHRRFIEGTNPDALAFHEAIADIVALFQHFSFPEVLRHQIAHTRGDLSGQSELGRLAQQFGRAIGKHGALREAIGTTDPTSGEWKPLQPDPQAYQRDLEPHSRGAILVAAVFDAFLAIYRQRVADLLRIASAGTGLLSPGALHPDLVNRLASEAAKAAQHVLNMCVRALDYLPPVDVTFGEYLRAIITADDDLVPDDDLGYRVAFIEAFRRRGLYPRDVRTLSVDALRWSLISRKESAHAAMRDVATSLTKQLSDLRTFATTRQDYFERTRQIRRQLHGMFSPGLLPTLKQLCGDALHLRAEDGEAPEGLKPVDASRTRFVFEVHNVLAAQRVGPDGQSVNHAIVSITQSRRVPLLEDDERGPTTLFRGGVTLIFDLDSHRLQYVIHKGIANEARLARQRDFVRGASRASLRGTYLTSLGEQPGPDAMDQTAIRLEREPFALLHRDTEGGLSG